jgi:tetratricopeptide (TPR) repeat protein
MATIDDSIRKINEVLAASVAAVQEVKDMSDPIEFEKSVISVLEDEKVTLEVYRGTPYEPEIRRLPANQKAILESRIRDYVEFKGLLRQTYAAGFDLNWDSPNIFGVNQKLEEIAGKYMGNYNIFCMNLLAVEVLRASAGRRLSEAERLDDIGDELNQKRKYIEALPYFDKALDISPKFCLAWINKGIALKNLGKINEAIACYDHVINDINPRYKKAWGNKANTLILINDFDNARICIDRALEIDPNYQYAQMLKRRID